MENSYQNPPAAPVNKQPGMAKAASAKTAANKEASPWKLIGAVLVLAGFFFLGFIGILISQKQYQSQGPVAPNVPESQPEAAIQKSSCTLSFSVTEVVTEAACGYSPCDTADDCQDGLVCITANNGSNYCGLTEFEEACAENPSVASCCTETTPTPTPEDEDDNVSASASATATSSSNSSVNVTINNRSKAEEEAETGGTAATATQSTTTKGGQTAIVQPSQGQPELPEELPVAGPEDWLKYLQTGLAVLGIGALLLFLL